MTRLRGRLDEMIAPHVSRALADIDAPVLELLRLGTYQIHYMDSVPAYAGVSTTVDQVHATVGRRPAGFVNAVLRKVAADQPTPPDAMDSTEALAGWGSHPKWLVRRWLGRYSSDDVRRLVEHDNRRPATCIVPLGKDADEACGILADRGLDASPAAAWSPCLRLGTGVSVVEALAAIPASIVQDPASNLVVQYADVSSGTIVADLCSAPGGKSLALSDRAARVIAADRSESRIRMVKDNAHRTGRRVEIVVADAVRPSLGPVDVVLLDAPCSGTGTLARHPDARWRLTSEAIEDMASLQTRMLDAAAELVRPGGLLVYSTCTLEPEENEDRVADFLTRHRGFSIEPTGAVDRTDEYDGFVDSEGYLRVEPWRSGYDGSFAARLRRVA